MRFMDDPAGCDPVASLGFDVLAGVPSAEDLAPVLAKRRVAIKNVLLDQVHCVLVLLNARICRELQSTLLQFVMCSHMQTEDSRPSVQ